MFEKTDILYLVRDGMEVLDVNGTRIGFVKFVNRGETRFDPNESAEDTSEQTRKRQEAYNLQLQRFLADLTSADHIPYEVREKMKTEGFARLSAGLFHEDRYILPNQIMDVGASYLMLRTTRDGLLRV